MGAIPLDQAWQQFDQAAADLRTALDSRMTDDDVSQRLAMATCLQGLRYIEANGLTDEGRKRLRTSLAACRAALGIEA